MVRLGHDYQNINVKNNNYLDLANKVSIEGETAANALLQIYFLSRCKFFLGNSSGIAFVASVFGKPVALANLVPFEVMPFLRVIWQYTRFGRKMIKKWLFATR